MTRLEEMSKKN